MQMDYINIFESRKNVMFLDTLDLALLPTSYSSRLNMNNKNSLWTVDNVNLKTSDYYEFEIKPKTDDTKPIVSETLLNNDTTANHQYHDHQSIPNSDIEVTMCHMCDIEVPSAYLNDHDNSMKHKTYVQIGDIILERTRKHILMKSSRYVQQNISMYFCEPCASIVPIVNKDKHKESDIHKQSVALDRLLHELVAMYTNEEYRETVISSFVTKNTTSNDAKDVQIEKDAKDVQIVKDAKDVQIEKDAKDVQTGKDIKNVLIVKDSKDVQIEKDAKNVLIVKNAKDVQIVKDAKDVQIELDVNISNTLPISDIKARSDEPPTNYNAGREGIDNVTHFCHICNLEMHINNIDSHINGMKHAMNCKSNFHYLMKQEEGSSNLICRVCNIYVQDDTDQVKEHVASSNHVFKYKDLLSTNYVFRNKGHFYCELCDVNLFKKNEIYHMEKLKHKNKLDAFIEMTEVKQTVNSMEICSNDSELIDKSLVYVVETGKVYVPNVSYNISSHNDGIRLNNKSHGNQLQNTSIINAKQFNANEAKLNDYKTNYNTAPERIDNVKHFCYTCNLEMHINNIDSHINGTRHAMNSKSNVHYVMKQEVGSSNLICRVCNVYVQDNTDQVKEHVASSNHVFKYNDLLSTNYMIGHKGYFYCELCDVYLSKMHEIYHMEKLTHKNTLYDLIGVTEVNQNDDSMEIVSNDSELLNTSFAYVCENCRVYDPNNSYNISGYNEEATYNNNSHGKQFQNISINEIKVNDKTNYNAAPEAIDDVTHFCHTCNLEMHVNNIDSHINGTKHAMNCKSNLHYLMKQEEGSSNLICRVCNIYVQDDTDQVKEHVVSSDHVSKYKDLLSTNYVIRHKNHFFCRLCDVNLFKMNEICHTEKLTHKNKLDAFKDMTVVN